MNTVQKIAGACFIGAFIGSLVALQLHHLWCIGLLIGAIVGYVVYEFKEIPATAKYVWNRMPEKKLMYEQMKDGLAILLILVSFAGVMAALVIAMSSVLNTFCLCFEIRCLFPHPYWFYIGGTSYMAIIAIMVHVIGRGGDDTKMQCFVLIVFAPAILPIVMISAIIGATCYGIYRLIHSSPTIARVFWKLCYKTFRIVHSDMRLLCMTDAAIGTLIGFWSGNALIGGVAGAVCGIINYEIVSVRWLKLAPQRT